MDWVILKTGWTQYLVERHSGVKVRETSSVVNQKAPSGASIPDAMTVVSALQFPMEKNKKGKMKKFFILKK